MTNNNHEKSKSELEERLLVLKEQGIMNENVDQRISELDKLEKLIPVKSNEKKFQSFLKLFKALGNQNRLLIIWLIMNGVRCACEIEHILGLSQSTVSHHMNELIEVGAIDVIKSGKWSLVSSESTELSAEFFISLLSKAT